MFEVGQVHRRWSTKELQHMYWECVARSGNVDYAHLAERIERAILHGKCVRFSLYEKDLIISALLGDDSETEEYKAFERKLYKIRRRSWKTRFTGTTL